MNQISTGRGKVPGDNCIEAAWTYNTEQTSKILFAVWQRATTIFLIIAHYSLASFARYVVSRYDHARNNKYEFSKCEKSDLNRRL
jgi:hypothetical protein